MTGNDPTDDETANLYAKGIDAELKAILDARPGTLAENVNMLLWRGVGGKTQAEIEQKIEHSENRIADFESDISELQRALEEERERLESLQQQHDDVIDGADTEAFRDAVDGIVEEMVAEDIHMVAEVANKHVRDIDGDATGEETRRAAMERAVEVDAPIPAKKFYPSYEVKLGEKSDADIGIEGYSPQAGYDREYTIEQIQRVLDAPRADELTVDEMDDWEGWS